jgi:hypothetical protein
LSRSHSFSGESFAVYTGAEEARGSLAESRMTNSFGKIRRTLLPFDNLLSGC